MTYSAKANPNATNSELDSKRIITHKELTSTQRDELIEQYVDIVVDSMDRECLLTMVTDHVTNYCDSLDRERVRDIILEQPQFSWSS